MSVLLLATDEASQTGEAIRADNPGYAHLLPFTFYVTGSRSAGKVIIQASPTDTLDDWVTFKEFSAVGFDTVTAGARRIRATTDSSFSGDVKVYLALGG